MAHTTSTQTESGDSVRVYCFSYWSSRFQIIQQNDNHPMTKHTPPIGVIIANVVEPVSAIV